MHNDSQQYITVLLAEDHHVAMDGLRTWFAKSPDFKVIGTAGSASAALQAAEDSKPDVVVLDLHLADNANIENTIKQLLFLGVKVAIFSAESRRYFIDLALRCGASAFISKSETYATLAMALRDVCLNNGRFVSTSLTKDRHQLTEVEKELLPMLAKGMKYEDIASRRITSAHTVRKQCDRLQAKLHLASREELIAWAVTNGYAHCRLSEDKGGQS